MKMEKMKSKTMWLIANCVLVSMVLSLVMCSSAWADDGQIASVWLARFTEELSALTPVGQSQQTDERTPEPRVLNTYSFGTVLTKGGQNLSVSDVLEIELNTDRVTDYRGKWTGMPLQDVLNGLVVTDDDLPLSVLSIKNEENGWSWVYADDGHITAVEYITYSSEAETWTEYILTYLIENNTVKTIRMKIEPADAQQATDGLKKAREIQKRQSEEKMALANTQSMFKEEHLSIAGKRVLGKPVSELIGVLGEPKDIQTLTKGNGRVLVYDHAVVRLSLDQATGEEVVRGISVSSSDIQGPNGLAVGMTVTEATERFLCENNVRQQGGTLYHAGESTNDPPYGELIALGSDYWQLMYVCKTHKSEEAVLEAGIQNGRVSYWRLGYMQDEEMSR